MKQVFETKPGLIHLLLLLGSLVGALDILKGESAKDYMGWPVFLAVLVGIITLTYLLTYFVVAPLSTWLGKKLGGTGTVERVRYVLFGFLPF